MCVKTECFFDLGGTRNCWFRERSFENRLRAAESIQMQLQWGSSISHLAAVQKSRDSSNISGFMASFGNPRIGSGCGPQISLARSLNWPFGAKDPYAKPKETLLWVCWFVF